MRIKTDKLVICSLFSAIIAVSAQIIIPIGIVPLSLASLAVMICGGVLGAKFGVLTVFLYICIGAVGVPVFAGLKGGMGILFGPTGGFIAGYLPIVFLSGYAFGKNKKVLYQIVILTLSVLVCYALGICWYMYVTKSELWVALLTCVLPFIPGDIAKIVVAILLVSRIKKYI